MNLVNIQESKIRISKLKFQGDEHLILMQFKEAKD